MFVSVKKIISAFETRRQPRPLSLPPSLPHSFPSKLSPLRSPKHGSQLPSASSTSPGSILTDPSPRSSPPLSRSSSAPSSPSLRRAACFSVSPSCANAPPVVLRSSHPNLHLGSHKMPSGHHHALPAPPSWPRHPVTPPPVPRPLKLPRGPEGLGWGHAGVGVRSSWPSSRAEQCSCGRERSTEVTGRRSPCSSISCERTGQSSSRESLPNPHTPGGPSVSHSQAGFGKTGRGYPGDRETSSSCFNRLKPPALPSPIPLTIPRKQNQIHSPTLTRKYTLSVPSQPITDPGLSPVLKPQPYGTHNPDLRTGKDLATFTPVFCPSFLDSAQTQNQGLASDAVVTDRATCCGSSMHQSQDPSGCPSLRAQGRYWNSSPIGTCDRQTQTQSHCDIIMHQTGSVGHSHISKEVQTDQLFSRMAQHPFKTSAPSLSESPGLHSTREAGPNSESWTGSASFRHGQNYSSGAFPAQDHNGNKLCLPSSVVNLGSLNNAVGSHGCVGSNDLKVGTSPAASELISSITCSHPSANPAASVSVQGPVHTTVCGVAVQSLVHTTATGAPVQGPVHTAATGAPVQGPVHTAATGAYVQGPVHRPATGAPVQGSVHTTATGAYVQGPIHTTATGAHVQGPVHTAATGAYVQGPVHRPATGAPVQGPVHTTATGAPVQGPVHTTATGAPVQGPVHTTATGAPVQGPVHTAATGAYVQGPVHTTATGAPVQGPVHTTATGAHVQGPVHTTATGAYVQGPVHTTATGAHVQGPVHTTATGSPVHGAVHTTAVMRSDISGVPDPALPKTSEPFPHGAQSTTRPSRVKAHVEANELKEPKAVPLTLARNSDKAFLSLLLFIHSGSSNSMIAIDNKIEQAMDLVKTHLMMAVREEVELLREQIKELTERNAQLERENYILRALRERD
ncbi:mucin-5AC isoform X1 [Conger conger]|uniref:mucin-5AC isoform X1 n=1 Tax=Conger conger TaxID=82655 RepID=UPI002A5B032A|nr:mucin-5AC isoform X1 [Conger conger]